MGGLSQILRKVDCHSEVPLFALWERGRFLGHDSKDNALLLSGDSKTTPVFQRTHPTKRLLDTALVIPADIIIQDNDKRIKRGFLP